ncbi:hypothetical protein KAU11_00610 [Candidatus Babeliales bacterium]|nr:hypothetical protein [Candidatus Babeliales bacterium]
MNRHYIKVSDCLAENINPTEIEIIKNRGQSFCCLNTKLIEVCKQIIREKETQDLSSKDFLKNHNEINELTKEMLALQSEIIETKSRIERTSQKLSL